MSLLLIQTSPVLCYYRHIMSQLIATIVGGLIVAILISWFGIGSTKVVVQGSKLSKTGKKIILTSVVMIILGVILLGQHPLPRGGLDLTQGSTLIGIALGECGFLLLIIGKVVVWYQR